MAELRRHYSEQVEVERRLYAEYAAGRTQVIDLLSDEEGDGDGGGGGNNVRNVSGWGRTNIYDSGNIFDNLDDDTGLGPMIGGLSRAEWKALTEESDSD